MSCFSTDWPSCCAVKIKQFLSLFIIRVSVDSEDWDFNLSYNVFPFAIRWNICSSSVLLWRCVWCGNSPGPVKDTEPPLSQSSICLSVCEPCVSRVRVCVSVRGLMAQTALIPRPCHVYEGVEKGKPGQRNRSQTSKAACSHKECSIYVCLVVFTAVCTCSLILSLCWTATEVRRPFKPLNQISSGCVC